MYFNSEPAAAKELNRIFRLTDDIIRHNILRIEPQYVDTTRLFKDAATEEMETESDTSEESFEASEEVAEQTTAETSEEAAEEIVQDTIEETAK